MQVTSMTPMPRLRDRAAPPDPAFAELFAATADHLPGGPELAAARARSFERFAALGIPTRRLEAWKYTDAAKALNRPMALARPAEPGVEQVARHLAGGTAARRLIFVNGELQPGWSHAGGLPKGMTVRSLKSQVEIAPDDVLEAVAALDDGRSFTALNSAFLRQGVWIELDPGTVVAQPLQLLFLSMGEPAAVMSHPRVVLGLGARSSLTLLESHAGLSDGQSLTNLVVQLRLGEGAVLRHDRLQLATPEASFVGKLDGDLATGSRYVQTVATMGGALVRNETEMRIDGRGVECLLNGAFMPIGTEHVDNLIRIHHRAPGSHSDQFYKGVINGRSRAAFQGKIVVHVDAQQTNAFQTNNNLLLSDDAELDTKPELEIYADDVKCSHGATSGDHDPLALFYLRSRGFDRESARSVLTYAFAAEVFERFADPTMQTLAKRAALTRLPGGTALMEML